MTHRGLISLVNEIREELASPRAVLEAFARAASAIRDIAPEDRWARSVVLTRAGVAEFLNRDDVLGAAYQALNAPALEAAYRATAREKRKFSESEISAVTGLYTPLWLAEHLVRETLERPWREADPRPLVRGLSILDPACGTMNFGLAAADALREMYREEMANAGRAGWPAVPSVREEREIGPAILRHNLHGIDVDATALWLAELSLRLKLGSHEGAPANLVQANALARSAAQRFDVVVTNPPFASARNLPVEIVRRLKKDFPIGWRDLYACFIERCIELARRDRGRVGMLTMQSFMFTGAFESLRERIDERAAIESIVHLGPGLFAGGNPGTLQTVAFTLRREPVDDARAAQRVRAISLVNETDKQSALRQPRAHAQRYEVRQSDLRQMPRGAWTYWASPAVRNVFATFPKLRESAPPRQGLATTDNARFVRYWWEVEPTSSEAACRATPGRWFAYAKSGRFRRWYEAPRHRVNWQDDGREIKAEIVRRYPYLNGKWEWVAKNASWYGRPGGVTYSYLTSGRFSARRLEPGCVFDVAGSCVFPPGGPLSLLGILNSSVAAELLGVINPTVNFQVGDLAELPVPRDGCDALAPLVADAIGLQRQLDGFDETTTDFLRPATKADGVRSLRERLFEIERQIDSVVAGVYGIATNTEMHRAPTPPDQADLAARCVSYAMGRTLGRWGGEALSEIVPLVPASRRLIERVKGELSALGGVELVDEAERRLNGIGRFIERDFYPWHVAHYARRPVYWGFGNGSRVLMLAHDRADAASVGAALRRLGGSLPAGWSRHVDDGVAVNLAPLHEWVADLSMRKVLQDVAAELTSGRLSWSATAQALSRGLTGGSVRARSRTSTRRPAGACPPAARR